MQTLIKITYHKPTGLFYALTSTSGKDGKAIQKYGNDWNIYAATKEDCRDKATVFFKDDNPLFVN